MKIKRAEVGSEVLIEKSRVAIVIFRTTILHRIDLIIYFREIRLNVKHSGTAATI